MLKAMDSGKTDEMMHDKAKQEPKTCVWWDINSCPVPDGYDAGMVCERIVSALNHTGYTGPVTSITAFGHLSHTLNRTPDILRAIYSSGIHIHHTNRDFREISTAVLRWTRINPSPATVLLITGEAKGVRSLCRYLSNLKREHRLLLAVPYSAAHVLWEPPRNIRRSFYWETLLSETPLLEVEPSRHALKEKICETSESPCRFFCHLCRIEGQRYSEDIIPHLKSRDHLMHEVSMAVRPPPKRKLVKSTFNVSKYINQLKKDSNGEIEEDRMSL